MPAANSRRRFLQTGASAALGTSLAPFSGSARESTPDDDLTTVSIIHTTDLHGHIRPAVNYDGIGNVGGFARCATLIREWKRQNPNHLLVDAGDLYQGTHVSRRNRGKLMMKLLNAFNYNGWVLGNHEFDWGIDPVADALSAAEMPALGANLDLDEATVPKDKVQRSHIETVDGFRIGFFGLTTPGLPYWLNPKLLDGISATDPAAAAKAAIAEMKSEKEAPHAVISVGHMGTKNGQDDYANRAHDTMDTNDEIEVFIAGHTHRDFSSYYLNGKIYTQSAYWGINLGRIDLTFSKSKNALIDKRAFTVFMDRRFEMDPLVLQMAKDEIEASEEELAREIGKLSVALDGNYERGKPNGHERLIAAAISHSLAKKKVKVDAVFHGPFSEEEIQPQNFTVSDVWEIIPYENMVVTADLKVRDVVTILEEAMNSSRYTNRNLIGLDVQLEGKRGDYKVVDILDPEKKKPLKPDDTITVAFNSYDAQSGGRRLMELRGLIEEPSSRSRLHELETRECLIDFFLDKQSVSDDDLVV
ncbi:MAG: bifunctional UDP-sugar hydrolase/5'-nucleotidase [Verrucomicrobiota bacterium]